MKKTIKLEKIADAITLVNMASKISGGVWLSDDKGSRVSGKSLLGVFDVAVNSTMCVDYPDSNDDFDAFLTGLEIKAVGYMPNA